MKIDRYKMFESTNQVDLETLKVEKSKISEINGEIRRYLNQIYEPFGWSYALKKKFKFQGLELSIQIISIYLSIIILFSKVWQKPTD